MSSISSLIWTFCWDVSFLVSALILCWDFSTWRFDKRRLVVKTFVFFEFFCFFFETFNSKSESWSSWSPSSKMTTRFLFRFDREMSSVFGFGWPTSISETEFETKSFLNRWSGLRGAPKVSAQLPMRFKSTSSSWRNQFNYFLKWHLSSVYFLLFLFVMTV